MSDIDNTGTTASPQFTERELQLLGWAMQSLKSGPPEIDYEKLANFAGMGNPRSAGNAWAKIKAKLMSTSPDGASPLTPKKGRTKKTATSVNDGDEGTDSPKKTPRKRPATKQDVDGNASPKKKGRGKKASDDESANVKAEPDITEELKGSDSPVKVDTVESEEEI